MADPLISAIEKSVNSELVEALVGHQIGLMRYDRGVVNKIMALLGDSREHLANTLYARLRLIEKQGFDRGPVTTARALAQLQEINKLSASVGDDVGALLETELARLGNYEAKFQQELLKDLVPLDISYIRPSPEQLNALVTKLPYVGKFYDQHISAFAAKQFDMVADRVRVGVVSGESLDTIVRSVVGSPGMKYSDGVWTGRQKRAQVETLVRTSVNHTSSATRDEMYKSNSDIIKGVQIVATLDGRTTLICQIEDGKVYGLLDGPRPPFHYNCRTVTAPVLKSFAELTGDKKQKFRLAPGERASLDGVVSDKVTYEGWLRSQSVQMQRFVLGPKRQALYQKNPTMQLSRFADKFGRPMSLEELAFTDAKLFFKLSDEDIRSYVQWIGERRVTELTTLKKKALPPRPKPVPEVPPKDFRNIVQIDRKVLPQWMETHFVDGPVDVEGLSDDLYTIASTVRSLDLENRRFTGVRTFKGGFGTGDPLAKVDDQGRLLLNSDVLKTRKRLDSYQERTDLGNLGTQIKRVAREAIEPVEPEASPSVLLRLEEATKWARDNDAPILTGSVDETVDELVRGLKEWREIQYRQGLMSKQNFDDYPGDAAIKANWTKKLEGSNIGEVDKEKALRLQEAINENHQNRVYRTITDAAPDDNITLLRKAPALEPEPYMAAERIGGSTSAMFADDTGTSFWTTAIKEFAPGEEVLWQGQGIGGIVRHEFGHSLNRIIDEDNIRAINSIRARIGPKGVKAGLSDYADTNDSEFFSELFALITDEKYRRADWPDWVNEAGDHMKDGIAKALKINRADLDFPVDAPVAVRPGTIAERSKARKLFDDAPGEAPQDPKYIKFLEAPAEGELKEEIAEEARDWLTNESTATMHRDRFGNWTPERTELHEDILQYAIDKIIDERGNIDVDELTAHLIGGAPATGKSTAIRLGRVNLPRNHNLVAADDIKAWLPEYQRMLKGRVEEAAAFAHDESAYLQWELIRRLQVARARHYVSDGLNDGKIDDWVRMVEDAKRAGYRVIGDYNTVPEELAAKRSILRAKDTGRKVPDPVVRQTNLDISARLPQMLERDVLDELRLWDTEVSGKPTLVLEAKEGKIVVYDRYTWNRFVAQGGKDALDAADRLEDRIEYATPRTTFKTMLKRVEADSKGKAPPQRPLSLVMTDDDGELKTILDYADFKRQVDKAFDGEVDIEEFLGQMVAYIDEPRFRKLSVNLDNSIPDAPAVRFSFIVEDSEGRMAYRVQREIERVFDSDTQKFRLVANHENLLVGPDYEKTGIGKDIMRRSMEFYEQAGVSRMEIGTSVDMGAYAWPRYGFKQSPAGWDELRGRIRGKLTPGQAWEPPRTGQMQNTKLGMWRDGVDAQKAMEALDPAIRSRLFAILDDPDPRALWHLSDIDVEIDVDGEMVKLGRAVLQQEAHTGSVLDFDDTEAMARFWKYVGAEARGDEAEKVFKESLEELAQKVAQENRTAHYAARKFDRDAPGENPGDKDFTDWVETPAEGDEAKVLKKEVAEMLDSEESIKVHQDAEGHWLPEREKLHDDIVDYVVRNIIDEDTNVDVDELTFHMMGGGTASGKSTAIDSGFVHLPRKHSLINSDLIKDWIPEYQKMLKVRVPEGASFTHEESSYLAKRILARLFKEKKQHVVLDGTGDGSFTKSLKAKILQARSAGYRVVGDYNTLPDDLALKLSIKRAKKTGREVPEPIVRGTHNKVSTRMLQALDEDLFDELRLWDNEIHKKARLVAETKRGEKVIVHDRAAWERFIQKGGPEARDVADKLQRDGQLSFKRYKFDDLLSEDPRINVMVARPDVDAHRSATLGDDKLKALISKVRGDAGTKDLDFENMFEDMLEGTPYKVRRVTVEGRDYPSRAELSWFAEIVDADDVTVATMKRVVTRDHKTGKLTGMNNNIEVIDTHRGLGKLLMRAQVKAYKEMGVESVDLQAAAVGPYAWARYGWVPSDANEWIKVRRIIRKRLSDDEKKNWAKGIEVFTPQQRAVARGILDSDDPRAIWEIADMADKVDLQGVTHTVGKLLLKNNGYDATMDMTDPFTMARFWRYVGDADVGDKAVEELEDNVEIAVQRSLASRGRSRKVFDDAPGDSPLDEDYVEYLETPVKGKAQKKLEKDAEEIFAKGVDTEAAYKTPKGDWTPERQQLHEDIIDSIMAALRSSDTDVDLDDLTFHFMGGGPASAKTTAVKEGFVHLPSNHVMINADAIKEWLPEYQTLLKMRHTDAANFVHEESSYLSEVIRKRLIAEQKNHVVLDGTGDGKLVKLLAKIDEAKAKGYRVVADYNTLPEDLAWKIAQARAKSKGRHVPEPIVRGTHKKVSVRFMSVVDEDAFDEIRLWDNEIKGVPRLVLEKREGKYVVVDRDLWRKFVEKGGDDARALADRLEIEDKLVFLKKKPKSFKQLMKPDEDSDTPSAEAIEWVKQKLNVEGQPEIDAEEILAGWVADTEYEYRSVSLSTRTMPTKVGKTAANINAEVYDKYGVHVATIERRFVRDLRTGELRVDHKILFVDEQARGFGRQMLRRSFEEYERLGVTNVHVSSTLDLGGYAWARYGFTPSQDSWNKTRDIIRARLFGGEAVSPSKLWEKRLAASVLPGEEESKPLEAMRDAFRQLSPEKRAAVAAILDDDNPRAVWRLADLRDSIDVVDDTEPLGRALLWGEDLRSDMRLDDHSAMSRMWRYMGDIKRADIHANQASEAVEQAAYFLSKGTVDTYLTESDTWKSIRKILPVAEADDPTLREEAEEMFRRVAREQIAQGADDKTALKAAKVATEQHLEAEATKVVDKFAERTLEQVWEAQRRTPYSGIAQRFVPDLDAESPTAVRVVPGRDPLMTDEVEQLIKTHIEGFIDHSIAHNKPIDSGTIMSETNRVFESYFYGMRNVVSGRTITTRQDVYEKVYAQLVKEGIDVGQFDESTAREIVAKLSLLETDTAEWEVDAADAIVTELHKQTVAGLGKPTHQQIVRFGENGVLDFNSQRFDIPDSVVTKLAENYRKRVNKSWDLKQEVLIENIDNIIITPEDFHNFPLAQQQYFNYIRAVEGTRTLPQGRKADIRVVLEERWKAYMDEVKGWDREQLIYNSKRFGLPDEALQDADNSDLLELFYAVDHKAHERGKREILEQHRGKTGATGAKQRELLLADEAKNQKKMDALGDEIRSGDDRMRTAHDDYSEKSAEWNRVVAEWERTPGNEPGQYDAATQALLDKLEKEREEIYKKWSTKNAAWQSERADLAARQFKLQDASKQRLYRRLAVPQAERQKLPGKMKSRFHKVQQHYFDDTDKQYKTRLIDDPRTAGVKEARKFIPRIWHRHIAPDGPEIRNAPEPVTGRWASHFDPITGEIRLKAGGRVVTGIHEYAHWMEHHDPEVHRAIIQFLKRRTEGETVGWMGGTYDPDEMTFFDKWRNAYVGRVYSSTLKYDDADASEVLSMGLQWLYEDPVAFAKEDPEMFDFIVNLCLDNLFMEPAKAAQATVAAGPGGYSNLMSAGAAISKVNGVARFVGEVRKIERIALGQPWPVWQYAYLSSTERGYIALGRYLSSSGVAVVYWDDIEQVWRVNKARAAELGIDVQ